MVEGRGQRSFSQDSDWACEACALKDLRLPRPLSQRELELLHQRTRLSITVDDGGILFSEGEPVKYVYIVRGGAVKTFVSDPEGKEDIIGFFFTGDVIALESMACDAYSMSCAALGKTYICRISLADMRALTHQIPTLEEYLFLSVSEELLGSHQFSRVLRQFSADERLASFLLYLSHTNERHQLSGTEFSLPMSRRDIASYLGLAVETVSRALTRLQDKALIAINDRHLSLLDIDGLKAQSNCCHTYGEVLVTGRNTGPSMSS